MKERSVKNHLLRELRSYPAVALLGPRQCGKTTLAKALGGHYFDLEDESDILRLDLAWNDLTLKKDLIVLDEAQAYPPVFKRIRSSIDKQRNITGRFLLLGSISPLLMHEVSQSLAGRLSLVELAPFYLDELASDSLDNLWLMGGFPDGGVLGNSTGGGWQRNYLALLAQRDLPAWGLPSKAQTTERLFKMLSVVHGNIWNASMIGKSLGLNYQTVNSYLEYLEGAFLLRRLLPFHANIRKRLVKSPKLYWRDSGLLHALAGVSSLETLLAQPWVGASWEGFIIQQVLTHLSAHGVNCTPYFLRTSDQYEADLVLDFGTTRWACEIKLTTDPKNEVMKRLEQTADLVGAQRRVIISRTLQPFDNGTQASLDLHSFLRALP